MSELRLVLLRTYALGVLGGAVIAEFFSLGAVLVASDRPQLSASELLISVA